MIQLGDLVRHKLSRDKGTVKRLSEEVATVKRLEPEWNDKWDYWVTVFICHRENLEKIGELEQLNLFRKTV